MTLRIGTVPLLTAAFIAAPLALAPTQTTSEARPLPAQSGILPMAGSLVKVIAGPGTSSSTRSAQCCTGTTYLYRTARREPLTELDASTGALVRVIAGARYGFNEPDAMVLDGPELFVASSDCVTELNASTGAFVKVLPGSRYGFAGTPNGMAVYGPDLFVTRFGSGSVAELNASTGALVRVISRPNWFLSGGVTLDGLDLFVPGAAISPENGLQAAGSLVEINASTGALVRVISGPQWRFRDPFATASDGPDVFTTDLPNGLARGVDSSSVTEVDASTGKVLRTLSGSQYRFLDPASMSFYGGDTFVSDFGGSWVTELDTSSGAVVRVISAPQDRLSNPVGMALFGDDIFVADSGSLTAHRCVSSFMRQLLQTNTVPAGLPPAG